MEGIRTEIACLKGIGPGVLKHPLIPLVKAEEKTIGRSPEASISIISNMISRKHAILRPTPDGNWNITDNKSLNGIFINDVKLTPLHAHRLTEGDLVRLGVPKTPDQVPEYVWVFHKNQRVRAIKGKANQESFKTTSSLDPDGSQASTDGENLCRAGCPEKKSKKRTAGNAPIDADRHSLPPPSSPIKRARLGSPSDTGTGAWSPSGEFRRRLEEQERASKEKQCKQEQQLAEMQKLLEEKEKMQEQLHEELKKKEEVMIEEMRKKQEMLEKERIQFEEQVKRDYEQQLNDQELALVTRLAEEKQDLIEEKEKIEQSLQNELERKLGDKDRRLQAELIEQKEKLAKVIEQKELREKVLESQLKDTKTENVKQKETVLRVKEDLLSNFADLMETELQCSICNELFVQATSLGCSHSFCALCIEQWMEVKKDCPVCRAAITSHLRSIVLDSYIDKMVEHLSCTMKESRKELVEERKAEMARRVAAKVAVAAAAAAGGRGRGGRRARGAARRRGGPAARPGAMNTRATNPQPVVIESDSSGAEELDGGLEVARYEVVDDDTSDSDDLPPVSSLVAFSDSDDSEASEEGYGYYGGYGSCFTCGRHGHWSNGCPY